MQRTRTVWDDVSDVPSLGEIIYATLYRAREVEDCHADEAYSHRSSYVTLKQRSSDVYMPTLQSQTPQNVDLRGLPHEETHSV